MCFSTAVLWYVRLVDGVRWCYGVYCYEDNVSIEMGALLLC